MVAETSLSSLNNKKETDDKEPFVKFVCRELHLISEYQGGDRLHGTLLFSLVAETSLSSLNNKEEIDCKEPFCLVWLLKPPSHL